MSFWVSFHPALLSLSGAHWLDDPPDLSCKDSTPQHAVDGSQLSCNLLPMLGVPPTTPRPWHRCPGRCFRMSPTMGSWTNALHPSQ
jgi:hypothetical protein